jgi:hypothetical protein
MISSVNQHLPPMHLLQKNQLNLLLTIFSVNLLLRLLLLKRLQLKRLLTTCLGNQKHLQLTSQLLLLKKLMTYSAHQNQMLQRMHLLTHQKQIRVVMLMISSKTAAIGTGKTTRATIP